MTSGLLKRGYSAEGIHGDIQQSKIVKKSFHALKNKQQKSLSLPDVAARGLDITGVTHVYNFDLPQDPESYVHRIGRTGRGREKRSSLLFCNT